MTPKQYIIEPKAFHEAELNMKAILIKHNI